MPKKAESSEAPPKPDVLVVGAGIAGMQAALEVADSGHQVYLVERLPSVGGHMLQLDKTFPTLDCASCIGTPKMSQVGSHKNIELMVCSEVVAVSGHAGDFSVKIRKKSKYVDKDACTGCNECAKVCPVSLPNDWQLGLADRQAIYRPFPQAVPNVFTIDKRGYPPCRATCPAGVNAQGYVALISQGRFKEALEVLRRTMPFAGVCGRVCNHPCESECERGKVEEPIAIRALKRFMADYELREGREKASPITPTKQEKVAIIGSGPAGITCAYDLAKEGYPVTVFEAAAEAGGLLRYGIPEYRLPNQIVDDEISYVREMGVEIKTNTRVDSIDTLLEDGYNAVLVAIGTHLGVKLPIPGADLEGVLVGISWLKDVSLGEEVKVSGAVVVLGGGSVAFDCARSALRLGASEVHIACLEPRDAMLAAPDEIEQSEQEGIIIHSSQTFTRIVSDNGHISGVECLDVRSFEFDDQGRVHIDSIEGSEHILSADTVIFAIGQRPEIPEQFRLATQRGNTLEVDPTTLATNQPGVFAAGDVVSGPADVIQAITAGKEAAISIDRYLRGVDLKEGRPAPIERVKEINKEGIEKKPRQSVPVLQPEKRQGFAEVELGFDEAMAIEEAQRCLNCGVCSDCLACVNACEPNAIHHDMADEYQEVAVGAIIVATGFDIFDPTPMSQYGYGRFDNVITSFEFERTVSSTGHTEGKIILKDGSTPKSVAIIHCVGSRDENYHEYCSRVCCMQGLKHAHLIREKTGAEVYQMYIDMRCFGKNYEEFYKRVSAEGINFIRGKVAQVTDIALTDEEKGKLVVVCEDTLLGAMIRVPVDMVVLSVALQPRADAAEVAKLFSMEHSADGFFQERHYKLDPMGTMTDGIFMAGCCQGPKDIPDTVAQAAGAAAKALALVTRGEVGTEAEAEAETVAVGSG